MHQAGIAAEEWKEGATSRRRDGYAEHEKDELLELRNAPCVHKFKFHSKRVLAEKPSLIDQVIGLSEKYRNVSGGENLILMLKGIRKRMKEESMSRDAFLQMLNRALRKSGATLAPVVN